MPRGYICSEIDVTDPLRYEDYRALALASIVEFAGHFIIMRGNPQVLEGDRTVRLVMIVKFDSPGRASEWYNSNEYQHAKAIGVRAANFHTVLLSGLPEV